MIEPLEKLKKILKKNKLDTALISSISNIVYLTGYSGFSKEEREAYLFITRLAGKRAKDKQYILTDGRYTQALKMLVPGFKLIEISSKLSFEKVIKQLIKKHRIKCMGFEGNNITFLEHKKLSSHLNTLNHFSLNNLRAIKDEDEISKIEKACKLGDKAFTHVLTFIKHNISEKEVANEIEFFIKKQGADISFPPIVAFGKNSSIPHHVPTNNKLTNNQIVLLDFGVKLNNYCSDMTRTIFFGSANAEFKKMYKTVLEAQSRALDLFHSLFMPALSLSNGIHNSIPAKNIDKVARDYIISKGYKTIPHSLGHGIGIDVHEAPRLSPKSKDILKPGMVFSIEPGIYISGLGGVRIEDLVVLEKSGLPRHLAGPRLLTHSPRTIIEL